MSGYYDRDRNPRVDSTGVSGTRTMAGTMNHPTTHVGNTAEYLASGYPYLQTITLNDSVFDIPDENGVNRAPADDDVISITLPFVSRWLMIRGTNGSSMVSPNKLFVGFSEVGVKNKNKLDVAFLDGTSPMEVKCSKLYFFIKEIADVDTIHIAAGLTNIPSGDFVVETSGLTNEGIEASSAVVMVHDDTVAP